MAGRAAPGRQGAGLAGDRLHRLRDFQITDYRPATSGLRTYVKNDDLKTKIRMLLLSNPQMDSCVYEMLAEAANHIGNLEKLVSGVLTELGMDWQDVGKMATNVRVMLNCAQLQKLHIPTGEIPQKSAEPAQNDDTIHLLALSLERLTRQFEPIITSDRITALDANALEVLERARDMDWDDGAVAEVDPLTVRECIIRALEFVSHSALGHDIGHLVHFANKAEEAMRQAIELLDEEAAARGAS